MLLAVRVIGCDGTGSMVDVVSALEWIHSNVQMPAAVLMSLGGPVASLLDTAAQSLTDAGITVVVAGGNSAGGDSTLFKSGMTERMHIVSQSPEAVLLSSTGAGAFNLSPMHCRE